jgi:hypothetical protein
MIERGRPVWLAFVVDDFELLASTAIERSAQSRFAETYRDSWSRGPALSLPTIRVIPSLPGRSVMMRCLRGGGRARLAQLFNTGIVLCSWVRLLSSYIDTEW